MSVQLTPEQQVLIEKVAGKEGFSDYETEVSRASVKGDGYLGIILMVNLVTTDRKLSLILKVAEPSGELRKKFVVRKAYLREIYVYQEIFTAFTKFQEEEGVQNGFHAFARIYGSSEEDKQECLLLENLKACGHKLWNRQIPMPSDHISLVFAEYGKFHAVSLAMRAKQPEKFEAITKDLRSIFTDSYSMEEFEYAMKLTLDNGFKAVQGDEKATKAMERYRDDLAKFLGETAEAPEDAIVVTHGDCWCNNMLFKYEVGIGKTI